MDEATSKVGSVVGDRYRIDREIGRGGMGVVYRATRLSDNATVALKMLLGDRQTEKQRARFEREIGLAAQMRHPNSLRVLEGGHTHDGAPFLAFELLEGRTLQEVIAQRGSFALERVVGIGLQVLGALEEAHRLSIIHRDIKPANIFLCPQPTPDFVKVLDFGVATQEAGGMESALTSAGAMVGTPHYMPPEQLGGGQVGPPSDLYALGLVLAEMIHGHRIVDDETLLSVYLTQASPEPLALPPTVTGTVLGPVVIRATAKNPAARYSSAAAMREALLATGVAPRGAAQGPPAAMGGFLRSQVWLAAAVAFLFGASVVSFTARGISARRDRGAEASGKTKSKGKPPSTGKATSGRVPVRLDRVTPTRIERALEKAGYEARLTSDYGKNHVWMAYDGDEPQGVVTFFDTDEITAMLQADMCDDGPATFAQDGGRVLCVELDQDHGDERALLDAITK